MTKKLTLILLFLLAALPAGAAPKVPVYTIGILAENYSPDMAPLKKQLTEMISAVVGQAAIIRFDERFIRSGPPDLVRAALDYAAYVNNPEIDIILAFGPVNNLLLMQKTEFPKPVVIFGAIKQDFITLPEESATSGIHNLTYLVAPASIKEDLETFADVYSYHHIGIILDRFLMSHYPVKDVLDTIFKDKNATYKLISIDDAYTLFNRADPEAGLETIDAVYLTNPMYPDPVELRNLIAVLNDKKIPTFSSVGEVDATYGVLFSRSSRYQTERFFRRVGLTIEEIINGKDPKDIPVLIDYSRKLTFNMETAQRIEFPYRLSQLMTMEMVGDIRNFSSDRQYSLPEVIGQVLEQNLDLQAREKNVKLALQDLQIAKSDYLPDLSVSALGAYIDPELAEVSNGANPEMTTSGKVVLEQVIYSEDASANIAIQEQLQQAESLSFSATELDAVLQGCITYFNVLIAKSNFTIQDENLRMTRKNFEIAEQNYSAGQSGKADVLRWKSELARATQNVVLARQDILTTFSSLNALLNNRIDDKVDVVDTSLEKGVFEKYDYRKVYDVIDDPLLRKKMKGFLVREAKSNAPEIKALDANIKAAKRTSALYRRKRFLPTVAVQGAYNYTFSRDGEGADYPTAAVTPPDGYYSAGVSLSLPVFQRNQLHLNRRKALIRENQLKLQRQSVELALEQNVNDIINALISQISNIKISKVAADAARESLDLTQIAYSSGAVSITSLIDAQQAYIQAQQQHINATYNYLINFFQMERIIGYFFMLHSNAENQKFKERFMQYSQDMPKMEDMTHE